MCNRKKGEDGESHYNTPLYNVKNFTKESGIENNIFEPQVLLETIITDLKILSQEVKSLQKSQAALRSDITTVKEQLAVVLNGGVRV